MNVKLKIPYLILCIIFLLSPIAFSAESNAGVVGILSFMVGDVYVSPDGEKWEEGVFDMGIKIGDHVKTGEESRCEVTLTDNTIVRLDENTIQQFEKLNDPLTYPPKSILLSAGKLWLNARKILSKEDSFKVRTNKAVCAIRGTTFSVEDRKTYTRIRVLEGEVTSWSALFDNKNTLNQTGEMGDSSKPYIVKGPHPISMEEWVEVVKALQQITIDTKGGFEKQNFDLDKLSKDPWVAWNMERDGQMAQKNEPLRK
jgi:hypothetical protein